MAEVEFLADDPPSGDESEELPTRPDRAGRRRWVLRPVAGVLWLAGAAAAVLAAFADRYQVSFGTGASAFRTSVDGWGRITGGPTGAGYQYEPRFGVLFTVCAGLFVLLAAAALIRGVDARSMRLHRLATGAGLLGVGALGGSVVAAVLSTASTLDNVRTSIQTQGTSGDPIDLDLHTNAGNCAYLGVAATVAGALAWLVDRRARRGWVEHAPSAI